MNKLKSWVVPALYVVSISIILMSVIFIGRLMSTDYEKAVGGEYIPNEIIENDYSIPVVEVVNDAIVRPYTTDKVSIAKNYYSSKSTEESQLNSLIFYKNSYMENTGILYKADEQFDVVAVLDGTVTSITEDEILGNVIEITHSTELITIYHCIGEVGVSVGSAVKQNDVIGSSGKVNIDTGYEQALLFEVNYQGKILDPNEFYNMKVSDLV